MFELDYNYYNHMDINYTYFFYQLILSHIAQHRYLCLKYNRDINHIIYS